MSWVGDDLASSVTVERHESGLDASGNLVPFSYRATHVFRREEDTSRIVLRHADPLVEFVGPDELTRWLGAPAGESSVSGLRASNVRPKPQWSDSLGS